MSFGRIPPISVPVESCKYFPTTSLALASPLGLRDDFELSSSRADSHALAARITTFAVTVYSCMSSLLTKDTPVATPSLLVKTSRAIALGMMSTFPVAIAGFTRTDDEEKSAWTVHPLLHCEQ